MTRPPASDNQTPDAPLPAAPCAFCLVDDHAVVRQGLRLFLGLDPLH